MFLWNQIYKKKIGNNHKLINMKRITILLFAVFAVFGFCPLSAQVTISGSTLDETENYNSLYAAFMDLNTTAPNSQAGRNIIIRIERGAGTVTNSQGLEDRGWTSLTVEGYSNNYLLTIEEDMPRPVYLNGANNVTIKNLNMSTATGNGLHVANGDNINVDNCYFSVNSGQAIFLAGNLSNKITNFTCTNSTFITGETATAFYLEHTDNVMIDGNVMILGGPSGIYFSTGNSNFTLKNSHITSNAAAGFFGANPVNIDNAATNVLIRNNNFFDLLRANAASNIIYCSNNATQTLIIDGNSFYETRDMNLPTGWSRYIYVGGGIDAGNSSNVRDLRIKNNFFGSTAAKCAGEALNLGTEPHKARMFACIETNTVDQSSSNIEANVDSIVGNTFAKISLSTTSGQVPSTTGEDKRGALVAYANNNAGHPVITDNIVENFTLNGYGKLNSALVGFAHTGSEPVFERNTFRNLITNQDDTSYSANVYAICIGNVNIPNGNPDNSQVVTFRDNIFDGLYANSPSTGNIQQVVAVRSDSPYRDYEGHSAYIGNKVWNLDNKATGSEKNIVAGFYSESQNDKYRRLFAGNEFFNLTLEGANQEGGASAIYCLKAQSSYIADNHISNISVKGGILYAIFAPDAVQGDTIVNNIIESLYNYGTTHNIDNLDDQYFSIAGIKAVGTSVKTIKGNTIRRLGNRTDDYIGKVVGIGVEGAVSSIISENFISQLNNTSSDSYTIGLYNYRSVKTFANNIVYLNNENKAFGMMNVSNSYFNTFKIKSSIDVSCGYYGTENTVDVKNNIFDIDDKGTGIYSTTFNNNIAYNNVYAPNGTRLYNAPAGSNIDLLVNYTGNSFDDIKDFVPKNANQLNGIPIGAITTDILGYMRNDPPTMGAWEINIFPDENNIIYVDINVLDGIKNGNSWENATRSLSNALLWARTNKDNELWNNENPLKIYIAIGSYKPFYNAADAKFATNGDRENAFVLVKDVLLYGGFDPANNIKTLADERKFGNTPDNGSVLSGNIGNDTDKTDNTYHVVVGAGDLGIALMNGFTVRDGYNRNIAPQNIYVNGLLVRNQDGAGIFLTDVISLELTNMKIQENASAMFGGGMLIQKANNNTVVNIYNSEIQGNLAGYGGGVMAVEVELDLTNVLVAENTADNVGGGIVNRLWLNSIYTNVLIRDNVAINGPGGGLYVQNSTVYLTNATITRNKANEGNSIYVLDETQVNVRNSIIWQHEGRGTYFELPAVINYTNTLLEDGIVDGTAIVTDANPIFHDAAANDFRLRIESPALSIGNVQLYNAGVTPDISRVTSDIAGQERISYNTIDLGAYQMGYNRWTGATDTDWDTASNWERNMAIVENSPLTFVSEPDNDLVIKENETHVVSKLYNMSENGAKIDILAGGALQATSADIKLKSAAHLHIRAAEGKPNGTFITPANVPVEATVEMYSKAVSDDSATKMSELVWQYFGTPVDNSLVEHLGGAFVLRSHNEHLDKRWTTLKNGDRLSVFKGYEVSRQPKINNVGLMTFRGNLINSDRTIPLSYTADVTHDFKGQHIISNPYTAALSIKDGLVFDDATEATVYFYHTGSRADWLANNNGDGNAAGQYYAIPQAIADEMPTEYQRISSMQGFLVRTLGANQGSVTFKYETASPSPSEGGDVKLLSSLKTRNSEFRTENPELKTQNCHSIDIQLLAFRGESNSTPPLWGDREGLGAVDRMWIFVNENSTRGFDNGYDGRKMFGAPTLAQLFSPEEDGDYQVNTVPDAHNTYLAFKAEAGISDYTLKFSHKNADEYTRLQLLDLENDKLTDISADGSEYTFAATNETVAQKRFKLLSTSQTNRNNDETKDELRLYWENNKLFVANRNNERITVMLYDAMGRMLVQSQPNDNKLIVIDVPIEKGIYIAALYSETTNETISKKIITTNK